MQAVTIKKTALPQLWFRLSVLNGVLVQLTGVLVGAALLFLAAHVSVVNGARIALMLLSWLVIYICCHAVAHWAVGRLVGIRFRGFGVRGTDHPENYPPVLRQIMSCIPFFTAMTETDSMRQARPLAKALMFAAGETSTNLCSLLAAAYAWLGGIPGGFTLFVIVVGWDTVSSIVVSIIPRGDYAKAIKALRS